MPIPTFTIDLSKPTYLDKGFINTGTAVNQDIGLHGENITLTLIDSSNMETVLETTINRTANPNQTPRLYFGYELSDWYYKHKLQDQVIVAQIIDRNHIVIDISKLNTLPLAADAVEPLPVHELAEPCTIDRIKAIGFRKVGEWKCSQSNDLSCNFFEESDSQQAKKTKNVLYAFSDDCSIYYIGKTTRELQRRMRDYSLGYENLKTNKKCHEAIKNIIKSGKQVFIYAFFVQSMLQYGEFEINIAAALEDSLINKVGKLWNGRQKTSQEKIDEISSDELDADS